MKVVNVQFIIFLIFHFSMVCNAQTIENIDALKSELETAKNDSVRIALYTKLAKEYWVTHPDSSYAYIKKRIDLATLTQNDYEMAKGNESLGVWLTSNGEYSKAIPFFNIALNKFSEINDITNVAYVYSSLGYAHLSAYETNIAISYYIKSLNLFNDLENEIGISEVYNEIGNLFYTQKNYVDAKCYFEDALVLKEKLKDSVGMSTVYTNLGNVVSEQNEFELGLDYYFKSILINEKLNDDIGLAINYNNIGDSYIRMHEFDTALIYLQRAQEVNNNSSNPDIDLEAIINMTIGESYLLDGKYHLAIKFLDKSVAISESINNLEYLMENYKFLSQSYSKLKEFEKATNYFEKYDEIKLKLEEIGNERKRSLFNTISELEESYFTIDHLSAENELVYSRFSFERKIRYALIVIVLIIGGFLVLLIYQQSSKKRAYKLLTYKNYLIEKMNKENISQKKDLEMLNQTKDKLFSIIGHDLKNPFNSILGFSELLIENFDSYDKVKQLSFLRIIKDSIVRANALLSNLLLWANNQTGNILFQPIKLHLINVVSNVIELSKIQAVNKDIELITDINPDVYVEADGNMLNTILRNLITNAIKFTEKGGKVNVYSQVDENFATIFVKDNGVGISKDNTGRLFNIKNKRITMGTNNEKGSGLGLILCNDFVKQNGGELFIESEINCGSTFYFTIPLYKEKAALNTKTA